MSRIRKTSRKRPSQGLFLAPVFVCDYTGLRLSKDGSFYDLYNTLPDKTRIQTSCNVLDIKQGQDGVVVTLADGGVERGDLVLGCDGVYSFVRRILWEHANKTSPGLITVEEKRGTLDTRPPSSDDSADDGVFLVPMHN